jgi:hypothetical protein
MCTGNARAQMRLPAVIGQMIIRPSAYSRSIRELASSKIIVIPLMLYKNPK